MMRGLVSVMSFLTLIISGNAHACSMLPSPLESFERIAAEGLVVKAEVIRGFDADKQESEIIRIDEIFVGEGEPRNLVIYRPKPLFAVYKKRHGRRKSVEGFPYVCPDLTEPLKAGDTFERLVLVPATSAGDPEANGRWTVTRSSHFNASERALETIILQATANGRFRARPPKSAAYGDCMTCSGDPRPIPQ